ncbi:uncharacterized protein MONOS_14900 [Monocercomonoides exilis]|uniref:uncharacterized protein n=1 Tax=Monocercomonoides exilis TaxID=2049356 RepID=UPI00355A784F|nr:hypothetical protein MONOS_14900 [Monocercomonoides exilis]|eukprot:MONOS_14900.1-p1 / transcript=MONOS_14900.1 / gene=MONOS_14900 / organism=Monocercomonoides_exilis_PA203 / gene_product=unspecified product / transcript_product=unspecified product / location=Mono_scaffold01101:4534-5301(+) / protein_length=256 / sequence_SO=supercontig / SO=protein_coding / is_pseudo=false
MTKLYQKFKEFSWRIAQNEVLCMAFYVGALMYDMYYIDLQNPAKNSLSSLGRKKYYLFVIYWTLTGVSLYLNVQRLFVRLGYTSDVGHKMLYTSLLMIFPMVIIISPKRIWHIIHIVLAVGLAVIMYVSLYLAVLTARRYRHFRYLQIGLTIATAIDVYHLLVYRQMALYAFIAILMAFLVCCFTNYTTKYTIPLEFIDDSKKSKKEKLYTPANFRKVNEPLNESNDLKSHLEDAVGGVFIMIVYGSLMLFKYME